MMAVHDLHPDDIELLERLGSIVAAVDPVPYDVVEHGKAAFATRRFDLELMSMVSGPSDLLAVREHPGASRLYFFEHGTSSIDLEATVRGSFARLVGIVTDAAPAGPPGRRVRVETSSSTTAVDVVNGRFSVDRVPFGLVRVVLERSGHAVLTTEWFEVG